MTAILIVAYGQPASQGSKRAWVNKATGRAQMVEQTGDKLRPWREAVKFGALAVKPNLDDYFPKRGPCLLCGVPGEDARHRVIDAVAGAIRAGDTAEFVRDDYNVTDDAILAALLPHTGPVTVRAVFTFARPRSHYRTGRNAHLLRDNAPSRPQGTPDLSKLLRSTEDALTDAGIWVDDARVVEYERAAKVWAGSGDPEALEIPGVRISIEATT